MLILESKPEDTKPHMAPTLCVEQARVYFKVLHTSPQVILTAALLGGYQSYSICITQMRNGHTC